MERVLAGFGYDAPLAVVGGPAQRGVQIEQRTDVVDALDGLRLEEGIEDELDVVALGQFCNGRAAEDGREAGAVEGQVEEVAALVVAVESRGIDGTVEPLADMELCRGLQTEVVGVVEVSLLHDDGHAVGGLIGQLHEVVRLKLGKGSERVLVVQLPHEVHLIFRHGLQVGIAPNLAVGRGVVDAAHRAPITGIDGLAAEREIEHILRVDVPHRVELRIDAPLVPFRGMVLLHRQRGVEASGMGCWFWSKVV